MASTLSITNNNSGNSINDPFPDQVKDEDSVAELFYTSGTTAKPKGVMLTHRNLYLHTQSVVWAHQNQDSDIQLHTIPLFHANAWGATHSITFVGGTHVMLSKFRPAKLFQFNRNRKGLRPSIWFPLWLQCC